jgi:hypothetical protein
METNNNMPYGLTNSTQVTTEQFLSYIVNYDNSGIGARPISFTSVTNPAHRKKGFPYSKLYKVGQTSGMLGTDYESNVNAQREREGKTADFEAQANNKMKAWLSRSVGVTNKDNTVIRYRPLNNKPSYWFVQTEDGDVKEINFEEVKPFLYEYNGNSQGLDEQIEFRLYGVDKIIAFTFEGNEGIISDVDDIRKKIFEIAVNKL